MEDTVEKVTVGEAVEAAVEAVENVGVVIVEDIKEEMHELSETTRAEIAAGLANLKKFVTGE